MRGRRVEYTIGWPVDERTLTAIGELREGDWVGCPVVSGHLTIGVFRLLSASGSTRPTLPVGFCIPARNATF
jgi:hypothetical protein